MREWLWSRLGTGGLALALLGLMWIGRGMVVAHDPGAPDVDEAILHLMLPVPWRIGFWAGTGVGALILAWTRWSIAGWC